MSFFSFASSLVSGGSFSPSAFPLNLYVRPNFTASPWVGTPSTGSSSSNSLTEATNPPTTGIVQNGWVSANFDGANDRLNGPTVSTVIGATPTAWSIFIIVNPSAFLTDGNYYDEACLFGDSGGNWVVSLSASGARISQWSDAPGSATSSYVPVDANEWSVIQARWTGTQVELRVNKGGWVGFAMSTFWSTVVSNNIIVGVNYDLTKFFSGRIAEIGVSSSSFSDDQFDTIVDYALSKYNLPLNPNMISGLQLWIDSENRVVDTGGLINSIGDRSYNIYAITQAGSSRPTISGGIFKSLAKKGIDTTANNPNYLNVGLFNSWSAQSVSYWAVVRYTSTDSVSGDSANPPLTVFGHTGGSSSRYVGFSAGQMDYRFPTGGTYTSYTSSITNLNNDLPHSVAWCHNADGTLRFYIDGVLDSTFSSITFLGDIQGVYLDAIGLGFLAIDSFVGYIAEACIFKADLSADQVKSLHKRAVSLWF